MLDLETNFYCESLSDVVQYFINPYNNDAMSEYDRAEYGNNEGSYTKLILISKVITALFEVA